MPVNSAACAPSAIGRTALIQKVTIFNLPIRIIPPRLRKPARSAVVWRSGDVQSLGSEPRHVQGAEPGNILADVLQIILPVVGNDQQPEHFDSPGISQRIPPQSLMQVMNGREYVLLEQIHLTELVV
jgi:hypothetical protein